MINWLWAIPWAAIAIFTVGLAVGNMIGRRTARKEDLELIYRQDNDRDITVQIDTLKDLMERRYDIIRSEFRRNEDRFLEMNKKLNKEENENG